jgi:hypothetical protein
MSPRPARALAPVPSDLGSNCQDLRTEAMLKQAEAMEDQAKALNRIADMGEHMITAFGPAAQAITDLGEAQKKLCNFLVQNRVKILLGAVSLAAALGAITPNAAHQLSNILSGLGAG